MKAPILAQHILATIRTGSVEDAAIALESGLQNYFCDFIDSNEFSRVTSRAANGSWMFENVQVDRTSLNRTPSTIEASVQFQYLCDQDEDSPSTWQDTASGTASVVIDANGDVEIQIDTFEIDDSSLEEDKIEDEPRRLTVGELTAFLASFTPDTEIHFEELTYYRLKQRGEKLVQIEFNEQPDGGTATHVLFRRCPL